jgi:hypothetical protein
MHVKDARLRAFELRLHPVPHGRDTIQFEQSAHGGDVAVARRCAGPHREGGQGAAIVRVTKICVTLNHKQ